MLWYAEVGTGLEVVYIHTYIHILRFLRGVRVFVVGLIGVGVNGEMEEERKKRELG